MDSVDDAEHSSLRRGSSVLVKRLVKKQKNILDKKRRADRTSLSATSLSSIQEGEDRARKFDGSFFELMNLLKETQNERLDRAHRQTVAARSTRKTHRDDDICGKEPSQLLDSKKRTELYKEFVYAIMYRLGKKQHGEDTLTDGEIYAYGREVLKIDDAEHKYIYSELKQLKPPKCLINVEVIAGSGLDPMDANGLSDPYCMLCLINAGEIEIGGKKKKLLRDFLQGDEVSLTKVIRKTLDPVWNTSFKFEVNDIQNQVLRIDVWDKDENSVVLDADNTIKAIKGFRGAGRMFKEIYQSATTGKDGLKDDFMGLVEVPLKTVIENGLDTWYQLENGNRKGKVHGKLHLKLSLVSNDSNKTLTRVSCDKPDQIYEDLLTCFTHHDMEHAAGDVNNNNNNNNDDNTFMGRSWDGKLSHPAESSLFQFMIQHQIDPLNISVIQWQVYSQLYIATGIQLDFLIRILESYKKHNTNYDGKNIEDSEKFLKSLDDFAKYSIQLLDKYRLVFDVDQPKKCTELGRLFMCLLMIYKLPLYKKNFPQKSLNSEMENIVVESTKNWFHHIQASFESTENTPLSRLDDLVNITNAVNADLQAGKKSYVPVFNLIKVKYIPLLFAGMELELSEIIKQGTKDLKEELKELKITEEVHEDGLGTKMFELYISVRDLCKIKLSLPEEDRSSAGISEFRSWFHGGVIKWISLAGVKAKARISKAAELDEVRVIDDMVKHSTSAVDVTCCLGQICTFWKSLEWTDSSNSFMFLTQITEVVGECGMHYADIIFNQLEEKGFYDDVGQFDVTDQLCIMMNNIAHVLQFFNGLSEVLGFEQVVKNIAEVHSESQAKISKDTLESIRRCAIDDFDNKIAKILEHVGKRMMATSQSHLVKIIMDRGANFDSISDPLLSYIDSNLLTLNSGLLSQVFERVLVHFWEDFLACAIEIAQTNAHKLTSIHYTTLADVVELMKEFFRGDNSGLPLDLILSDRHQKLKDILDLHTSTTKQLIEKLYFERCGEQKVVGRKMGSMTFKIFYCSTTRKLNINVLNCRDLVPMDVSGSSDPYISMKLIPDHMFSDVKKQKTRTVKNTLFPLFDETFQFDVSAADCSRKGATILFTLFDHDMLSDDICGEMYYDMQAVQGLNCIIQGGFTTIGQTDLSWCISAVAGETIGAIANRHNHDQIASNFIDKQKDRYRKMTENNDAAKDRPRPK